MDEFERVESIEPMDHQEDETAGAANEDGAEEEKEMDVPFGLLGASFLTNVLQYAVFLGVTMIVLIIIRVFMPPPMVP